MVLGDQKEEGEEEPMPKEMGNFYQLFWDDIEIAVKQLSIQLKSISDIGYYENIIPLGRGGLIPARLVARELNIKNVPGFIAVCNGNIVSVPQISTKTIIVDDIYDTGKTVLQLRRHRLGWTDSMCLFAFLYTKGITEKIDNKMYFGMEIVGGGKKWVVFPWENLSQEADNVQPNAAESN